MPKKSVRTRRALKRSVRPLRTPRKSLKKSTRRYRMKKGGMDAAIRDRVFNITSFFLVLCRKIKMLSFEKLKKTGEFKTMKRYVRDQTKTYEITLGQGYNFTTNFISEIFQEAQQFYYAYRNDSKEFAQKYKLISEALGKIEKYQTEQKVDEIGDLFAGLSL